VLTVSARSRHRVSPPRSPILGPSASTRRPSVAACVSPALFVFVAARVSAAAHSCATCCGVCACVLVAASASRLGAMDVAASDGKRGGAVKLVRWMMWRYR
jgi:hypothetical protein